MKPWQEKVDNQNTENNSKLSSYPMNWIMAFPQNTACLSLNIHYLRMKLYLETETAFKVMELIIIRVLLLATWLTSWNLYGNNQNIGLRDVQCSDLNKTSSLNWRHSIVWSLVGGSLGKLRSSPHNEARMSLRVGIVISKHTCPFVFFFLFPVCGWSVSSNLFLNHNSTWTSRTHTLWNHEIK